MTINPALYSSASTEWETPQDLFDVLDNQYKFNLDPCATKENAKCPVYFTKELDGLKQSWVSVTGKGLADYIPGRVFCNPPYGRGIVEQWIIKAVNELWDYNAELIVMLLPARTCTKWFQDYVIPFSSNIYFIRGRIKFVGSTNSAPFPSCLVIFENIKRGVMRTNYTIAKPLDLKDLLPRDETIKGG